MVLHIQDPNPLNQQTFYKKVQTYCRDAGRLQKELAAALGIDSKVLSRKLHGAIRLTHNDVKAIVKLLAEWDAIATQAEAIELLACMGLKATSFSPEEWQQQPLNRLEPAKGATVAQSQLSQRQSEMSPLDVTDPHEAALLHLLAPVPLPLPSGSQPPPARLPSGTLTFLFTDIEGSTSHWERYPVAMAQAHARHHALLAGAIADQHGHPFQIVGDAVCAAFATAEEGLAAALAAQQALQEEPWNEAGPIKVRMVLHTGWPRSTGVM